MTSHSRPIMSKQSTSHVKLWLVGRAIEGRDTDDDSDRCDREEETWDTSNFQNTVMALLVFALDIYFLSVHIPIQSFICGRQNLCRKEQDFNIDCSFKNVCIEFKLLLIA